MFENNPKGDPDDIVSELREGIDFYFENGFMVLKELYLKERGYCCGNSCRHCPYGYANVPDHNK